MPWGRREGFLEEVMSKSIRSQCERRSMPVLGKDSPVLELNTASSIVTGWVPWAADSAPGSEGRCANGEGLGAVLGETPRWLSLRGLVEGIGSKGGRPEP